MEKEQQRSSPSQKKSDSQSLAPGENSCSEKTVTFIGLRAALIMLVIIIMHYGFCTHLIKAL